MKSTRQYKVLLAAAVLVAGFIAAAVAAGNLASSNASAQVSLAAGQAEAVSVGVKSLEINNDFGRLPVPYAYSAEVRPGAVGGSPIIEASQDVYAGVNVVYLLG